MSNLAKIGAHNLFLLLKSIYESTSQSSYLGVPPTPHCMLPTVFCTLYQKRDPKNWHCALPLPVLGAL